MATIYITVESLYRSRPYHSEEGWLCPGPTLITTKDLLTVLNSAATATEDRSYVLLEDSCSKR